MFARIPASLSTIPVALGKSYISETYVIPDASISITASLSPLSTSRGVSLSSMGKIALSSQSCSASPPPTPLSNVIGP